VSVEMTRKILLVTRLATQNAGNQALSIELINFVRSLMPQSEVRAMDRYPPFFSQFRLDAFVSKAKSASELFDAACRKLIDRFGGTPEQLAPLADESLVVLDVRGSESLPSWMRTWKRRIDFRARMAAVGLVGKQGAINAVRDCQWPDLLIWNPAGEIHNPGRFSKGSGDQVLRLLLLVRIAQLSGVKTMVVNHSLETRDPVVLELLKHVYSNAAGIAVRDGRSLESALSLGLDRAKVFEIPDLVFLGSSNEEIVDPPVEERFSPGTICLSINGRHAYNLRTELERLILSLKQLNRPMGFLTNAMHHDIPFIQSLAAAHDIKIVQRQPGYREIRGFFRNVDVLIGSRFHSNIMALCDGIPVVSLEASAFKMTAAFDQMQYPIRTTQTTNPRWEEDVFENVREVLSNHAQISATSKSLAKKQAEIVRNKYRSLLAL
jgi:polysaccharide pyruvyl transferase WcaK-like protein